MNTTDNKKATKLDKKIIHLAQVGDLKGFMEAIMEHPVHGRLIRTFALEESAPEYAETMQRIRERFGPLEVVLHERNPDRHDG